MTTAVVYCPTSGEVIATHSIYCNKPGQPPHTIITGGYGNPIDISASEWRAQRLYASQVNSVRTERVDYCCTSRAHPWTRGVVVRLYSDSSGFDHIGTILFAHLESRINNDLYNHNNSNLWGLWIGATPGTDCSCQCYDGHHVHLEQQGAWRARGVNCGELVGAGQNWLYMFQW